MFNDLRFRLRALFDRAAMEHELDDELRFHLERETEKLIAGGMPPAAAARQASLLFGGLDRTKDEARDVRGVLLWDSLTQDVRYAWRGLRSRPGFTAAVTIALAIGIGANATMFSIVDRLLFRAPPYILAPDRVNRVYLTINRELGPQTFRTMEYSRYAALTRWTTSFERTGVIGYKVIAVGDAGDARNMTIAAMSATMFDFFGARPVIGRFFGESDDAAPRGTDVAVLSWSFWQSHYGGDSAVLNRRIDVGTRPYTIIGVAPPDFVGVTDSRAPVMFVPVTAVSAQRNLTYPNMYGWSWLEMFARRRPGVSSAAATADLSSAYLRSWQADTRAGLPPLDFTKPHAAVGSLHLSRGPEASAESKVFTWVMGVAAMVLLIACANVANLMLARAVTRRREVALRLALGVGRGRLLQQLATETLVLAFLGGAAGILFAYGGSMLLRPFVSAEDPNRPFVEPRTLLFVLVVTLLVAIATGIAPLFHAVRADINDALKSGTRAVAAGRSAARTTLLLVQGVMSVVLLVGAGLFVRSLWNLRTMRMGYDFGPLLYAEAELRDVSLTAQESDAMARRMEQAAAATPEVEGATLAASIPFWSNEGLGAPIVAGRDSLGRFGRFLLQAGSPSYFRVTGTRILAGRGFENGDRRESRHVAVISQRMGEVIWPGENPVGKQFRLLYDTAPPITIVGVAENMRARSVAEEDEIWYYLPVEQYRNPDPQVLIRVRGDPTRAVDIVRQRLLAVMPAGTFVTVTPLQTLVQRQGRSWELGAKMFVGFGAIALLLAAIGLYSVVAYMVAQRTREIGVRIALGASTGDVIRLVLRQGLVFAAIGIATGSLIGLWASRWIEPLLFKQDARDPLIFVAAASLLLLVAVVACANPALRAARLNPSQVLQSD